jgi:hypothetical protein
MPVTNQARSSSQDAWASIVGDHYAGMVLRELRRSRALVRLVAVASAVAVIAIVGIAASVRDLLVLVVGIPIIVTAGIFIAVRFTEGRNVLGARISEDLKLAGFPVYGTAQLASISRMSRWMHINQLSTAQLLQAVQSPRRESNSRSENTTPRVLILGRWLIAVATAALFSGFIWQLAEARSIYDARIATSPASALPLTLVVFGVALAALIVLLAAFGIARRSGVARGILSFAFIAVLVVIWLTGGSGHFSAVLSYPGLLTYLAGIVLFWLPKSNAVFRETREQSRESLRQANVRVAK